MGKIFVRENPTHLARNTPSGKETGAPKEHSSLFLFYHGAYIYIYIYIYISVPLIRIMVLPCILYIGMRDVRVV